MGEDFECEGNIDTETAIIFGTVNGNVRVKHLEIKETGNINGDVKTENLVIEMGGKYNGKLDMKVGSEKQQEKEYKREPSFEVFKKIEKFS